MKSLQLSQSTNTSRSDSTSSPTSRTRISEHFPSDEAVNSSNPPEAPPHPRTLESTCFRHIEMNNSELAHLQTSPSDLIAAREILPEPSFRENTLQES